MYRLVVVDCKAICFAYVLKWIVIIVSVLFVIGVH